MKPLLVFLLIFSFSLKTAFAEDDIQTIFDEAEGPSPDPDYLSLFEEGPEVRPGKNENEVLAEFLEEEDLKNTPLTPDEMGELEEIKKPGLIDIEQKDFQEFKQSLYSSDTQMGVKKKFSGWDLESIEVMDFVENEGLLYEDVINKDGFDSLEKIHKIEKTGRKKHHPPPPIVPRKKDFFEPENYFGILKKNSVLKEVGKFQRWQVR